MYSTNYADCYHTSSFTGAYFSARARARYSPENAIAIASGSRALEFPKPPDTC